MKPSDYAAMTLADHLAECHACQAIPSPQATPWRPCRVATTLARHVAAWRRLEAAEAAARATVAMSRLASC